MTTQPTPEEAFDIMVLEAAKAHGAVFVQAHGNWYVADSWNQPDPSYGILNSELAAALSYCDHNDIMPKNPSDEPDPVMENPQAYMVVPRSAVVFSLAEFRIYIGCALAMGMVIGIVLL